MSIQLEEPTFNVKRARLILNIFAFTFFGLILYIQFINAINIQAAALFLFVDCILSAFANYRLRNYEKEQKAEQERLRELEEKDRMQKEINALKGELEKNKNSSELKVSTEIIKIENMTSPFLQAIRLNLPKLFCMVMHRLLFRL
jgi:Skp family chaperone for outer membrane proteins